MAGNVLDEDMNVIRHYHPCDQAISFPVEFKERILDE